MLVLPIFVFQFFHRQNTQHTFLVNEAIPSTSEAEDVNLLEESYPAADFMDPVLYRAVTEGEILKFYKANPIYGEDYRQPAECVRQVSPQKNTVLHIATSSGHDEIVYAICKDSPVLVKVQNSSGDTPLHIAARAGRSSLVGLLVNCREIELRIENEKGNTALHEALLHRHEGVARILIDKDRNMSYPVNKEGKSLLYLAAEAGYRDIVHSLMRNPLGKYDTEAKQNKSPVHAAILGRNTYVLQLMWEEDSTPFNLVCEQGGTPLHCTAATGHVEGLKFLLQKIPAAAYQPDKNGFYPIHIASREGHIDIIQEILQRWPDSWELLNQGGQNILHVAAESGKAIAVSYMLNMPELTKKLINDKDKDGNTPLHLATIYGHHNIVRDMTLDARVELKLENSEGLTALDIAEENMKTKASFRKLLTWMALKVVGSPRPLHSKVFKTRRQISAQEQSPHFETYRVKINTILMMAILVASVTFAAGFSMPSGYNKSTLDQAMAAMLANPIFHAFVICDIVAMYSSIIVAVTLIWAQLCDNSSVLVALKFAMLLMGIALAMVSIAFMARVYLVVIQLHWLSQIVLVMGISFLITLVSLFVPLCSSSDRIFHLISYYPFRLVLFVFGSYTDGDIAE